MQRRLTLGENEVRRRDMRECEDVMMEDTASRRGYAPTAAWDDGNMIQAMASMKNTQVKSALWYTRGWR